MAFRPRFFRDIETRYSSAVRKRACDVAAGVCGGDGFRNQFLLPKTPLAGRMAESMLKEIVVTAKRRASGAEDRGAQP